MVTWVDLRLSGGYRARGVSCGRALEVAGWDSRASKGAPGRRPRRAGRVPATAANSGVLQRAGGSTARLPGRGQGMSAGDGREALLGRGCPRLAEIFLCAGRT
jgi:hypothetical protein